MTQNPVMSAKAITASFPGLAPSIFETAPRMGTTRYWILSATAEALGRVPSGRALTGLDSAIWVSSLAIALRTSLAAVFI